jgi:peptidoglycan hydrolase-like protein with peptidoglycan-binding domain
MTLLMFDSIYVSSIPSTGMDAVAGYVGGHWPTYAALVARFPHLPALSIAVTSEQDAQCLDVETGDATPALVPGWLDRQAQLHPDRTPIIYCSASWIPAVRTAAGQRKYLLWSAHYGKGLHICSPSGCGYQQADATQWTDKGPNGETVDQTLMSPAFLAAFTPAPTAPASDVPPVFTKPAPAPAPKPAPAPPKGLTVQTIDLRNADRVTVKGPGVKPLQRLLGVTADGLAGRNTKAALHAFQLRAFGHADDIFGPQSAEALLAGK